MQYIQEHTFWPSSIKPWFSMKPHKSLCSEFSSRKMVRSGMKNWVTLSFFPPHDSSQTHQQGSNHHLQSLGIVTQSENTEHNLHDFQQTTMWPFSKLTFSGNCQLLSDYYKIRKLFKETIIKQTWKKES